MSTKRAIYPVEFKTLNDAAGKVEALVSIFGNVDQQGDRVMPGAFTKSIDAWKQSGDPVPVVFSHDWGDVWSHIGIVDSLAETAKGLRATYTLDIADNPVAAQVYRLMKRRSLKEHSFAYNVNAEHLAKDGANELTDLGIIEIGPTLRGANPDTELIAVKSLLEEAGEIPVLGEKAGRRLSQATQAEMQAIHDDLTALQGRMATLMGVAEDAPKSSSEDDGADTAAADLDQTEADNESDVDREPSTAKSTDEDLLRLRTRIEEMCATRSN